MWMWAMCANVHSNYFLSGVILEWVLNWLDFLSSVDKPHCCTVYSTLIGNPGMLYASIVPWPRLWICGHLWDPKLWTSVWNSVKWSRALSLEMASCSLSCLYLKLFVLSVWCELLILYCLCSLSIQTCNVAIVTQPRPPTIVYERQYGAGDHYLLLSVILSFLCFFCGTWWALICTVTAIFFAISVSEAKSKLS